MIPLPEALSALGVIAHQNVAVTPALRHFELATWEGLLTLFWHGNTEERHVVLTCGGALGGVLGPGHGLFHDLGQRLPEQGIGVLRVGYRRPNDLDACVHDVLAAAELAARQGAERFITMGHSFGGAVAIQAGALLGEHTAGVVTLATQSAGCEEGESLAANKVPVILFHGDRDDILPYYASQMVQMLCGGELVIIPGGDHRLSAAGDELRQRLGEWIPARFA